MMWVVVLVKVKVVLEVVEELVVRWPELRTASCFGALVLRGMCRGGTWKAAGVRRGSRVLNNKGLMSETVNGA